jgi:glycosyltransferase involved in cell wall biosynthesis
VSIILPVRDGGRHLHVAVASLLAQSYADYELLVVDDGSRDGSPYRLPGDPRLRVLPSRGQGIVCALNTGWQVARGELIARMDADDIAERDRLAAQIDHLERHPDVALCGTGVRIFRDAGPLREGFRRYEGWLNSLRSPAEIAREAFVENPIPHPSLMLRRSVMRRLGGYREVPWSEDYDLMLRAHALGARMAKPEGIHLHWREHPDRLTHRDPRCSHAAFIRCKARFLAARLPRDRTVLLWGAGPTGARLADALTEQGAALRGFIDIDPRKIGRRKRGLPVGPPEVLHAEPDAFVIGAVGSVGARESIRAWLSTGGRREGADFLFAA